jgi:hypothetical protein
MNISITAKAVDVSITSPDGVTIFEYATSDYRLNLNVEELMANLMYIADIANNSDKIMSSVKPQESADVAAAKAHAARIDEVLRNAFGPRR